jgi:hypothetical protein
VRHNQGNTQNVWVDVATLPTPTTTYTITSLIPGEDYQIVVLAENLHGWSDNSDAFLERAADQPDQPTEIVTENDNTYLKVIWVSPFDNHRPITDYQVQALNQNTQLYEDICQGEWLLCRVEWSYFTSIGYVQRDLPTVVVRALNERGWSIYSEVNTIGDLIKTEPSQMN